MSGYYGDGPGDDLNTPLYDGSRNSCVNVMGTSMAAAEDKCNTTYRQRQSFCKRWSCVICSVVTFVVLLTAALLVVFVGGKAYADAAIKDAGIELNMALSVTGTDTVQANITGVVVNHAVFGATMKPTSLAVIYEGATVGNVAFPQVELVGGGTTAISILSDMTISDTTAFTAFAVAALQRPSVSLTMSGSIDVHAVGVTFDGLDFEKVVTLQGLSNFTTPPPTILSTDIISGQGDTLVLTVTCELPNYSSMALMNAGRLTMNVLVEGKHIGVAVSEQEVSFRFGTNNTHTFTVTLTRHNDNALYIEKLVSNYTSGFDVSITMQGTKQSTSVALLQDAFNALQITTKVPGLVNLQDKLLMSAFANFNLTDIGALANATLCPGGFFHIAQPVFLFANNKFSSNLVITATNLKVYWEGTDSIPAVELAGADFEGLNHVVPAHSIFVFEQSLCINFAGLHVVTNYLVNTLHVNLDGKVPFNLMFTINGSMTGTFDHFAGVKMNYTQSGVPGTMLMEQAPAPSTRRVAAVRTPGAFANDVVGLPVPATGEVVVTNKRHASYSKAKPIAKAAHSA